MMVLLGLAFLFIAFRELNVETDAGLSSGRERT
jgi:hypothetical protein